jgi:predicted nucleotidyltransferase component of viral defense system
MLRISEKELKKEAREKGYRPEMLEKVYHLLFLLEEFMALPYLSDRLALKGGTAINLFCANYFPRLSVDLDFNYIGSVDRQVMQEEKSDLEKILMDICRRRQYELHRNPRNHAGGKTVLIYKSIAGTKGRLEIDLNYLYRSPLWIPEWKSSPQWPKAIRAQILDIHELAAGKLNALLDREVSRDLFDSHQLLMQWPLDKEKMRLAFTVYAAMRKQDWENISVDSVKFSVKDIRDKLIPVLKESEIPGTRFHDIQAWAEKMVEECKTRIGLVLPFNDNEVHFLEALQKDGKIKPELITGDAGFAARIECHPLLIWRSQQALKVLQA